jgi:hypothetical protein
MEANGSFHSTLGALLVVLSMRNFDSQVHCAGPFSFRRSALVTRIDLAIVNDRITGVGEGVRLITAVPSFAGTDDDS